MRCRTRNRRGVLWGALILAAGAVSFRPVAASGQTAVSTSQADAAKKGLDALPLLITDANFSSMGFQTQAEAKQATLGKPVVRRLIGYDRLVKSPTDVAFATLLETTQEQAIYPVQVGDAIRTSILLTRVDNRWQIGSIGDASLGRLLREAGQLGAAEVQVVSVPGLNLDFLSIGQGPETMLVPAKDYPELHLARGQRVRANELVPQLVDYAKDFDRKYGEQIRQRKLVM